MKTCDIIIPAHNNADVLQQAIECIEKQAVPPGWSVSVVVCDDGSKAPLQPVARHVSLTVIRQKQRGAAAARNAAISRSGADIVLLLGADILLKVGALYEHILFHEKNPDSHEIGLGFVVWDPRLAPTPLMEWSTHGGPQNDFDALLGVQQVSVAQYFYGSHVSCKRELLALHPFNEAFSRYGHEDTELGLRLQSAGARLQVLHGALGMHRHMYSAADFVERQYAVGRSRHVFCREAGLPSPAEEMKFKHRLQLIVYRFGFGSVLTLIVRSVSGRYSFPRLFSHVAAYVYRLGVVAGPPSEKVR